MKEPRQPLYSDVEGLTWLLQVRVRACAYVCMRV